MVSVRGGLMIRLSEFEVFSNVYIFIIYDVRIVAWNPSSVECLVFFAYRKLQSVQLIVYITPGTFQSMRCLILMKKAVEQLELQLGVKTKGQSCHGELRQGPQPQDDSELFA